MVQVIVRVIYLLLYIGNDDILTAKHVFQDIRNEF